jgi:glutaredoxin
MTQYTIFGRPGCQPCANAKSLLESKEIPFIYKDVETLEPSELFKFMKDFRQVPQIYKGDTHIGGFKELKESFE